MYLKRFLLAILLLLAACPLQAGTATITWSASPDAAANPTLSYNVYRSTGSCPTTIDPTKMTKLGSATSLSYSDTTVSVGTWCYYVTSALNGAESVFDSTAKNWATGVAPPASPTAIMIVIR